MTTARRFQCITLPNDAVAINGKDFDNMISELHRLRGELERSPLEREPPHCPTCSCGMHKEKEGAHPDPSSA